MNSDIEVKIVNRYLLQNLSFIGKVSPCEARVDIYVCNERTKPYGSVLCISILCLKIYRNLNNTIIDQNLKFQ